MIIHDDDDCTFNDPNVAQEWIDLVEGEKTSARDGDIYPQLKSWVNSVAPKKILDIGCGQGVCSDKIDLVGRLYSGVEPSPLLLERAKMLYSQENRQFLISLIICSFRARW